MKLVRYTCLVLPLAFTLNLPAQSLGRVGGAHFVAQAEHLNSPSAPAYLTAAAHKRRVRQHRRSAHARSKKKSAVIIGGSALGGAAVGGLAGGGTGAAIGAAAAGGGYLYDRKTNNRNKPR